MSKRWLRATAWDTVEHYRRLWLYILAMAVIFFLVVPTFVVIPMSFSESRYLEFPPPGWSLEWYERLLTSNKWLSAIKTSMTVAAFTVLVATPMGTLAAYAIHQSRIRFLPTLYGVLLAPMLVPVIMVGIGLFFVYARIGLLNTITGLVLAHAMLAIPLVVITVLAGFKTYDMNQEKVARSLGAPRWLAFMTVTLPQIKPSILTAILLSFLTSLDEVIIALFVSGGDKSTVTRLIFNSLRDEIDPVIAAASTCLITVSILTIALLQFFNRERAN